MISYFLNQSVIITPKATTKFDKWGSPSSGTAVTYRARAENVQKRIQTDATTFVDIALEVWLPALALVENEDKVTFGGNDYRVVFVENKYDIAGQLSHIKVSCK